MYILICFTSFVLVCYLPILVIRKLIINKHIPLHAVWGCKVDLVNVVRVFVVFVGIGDSVIASVFAVILGIAVSIVVEIVMVVVFCLVVGCVSAFVGVVVVLDDVVFVVIINGVLFEVLTAGVVVILVVVGVVVVVVDNVVFVVNDIVL